MEKEEIGKVIIRRANDVKDLPVGKILEEVKFFITIDGVKKQIVLPWSIVHDGNGKLYEIDKETGEKKGLVFELEEITPISFVTREKSWSLSLKRLLHSVFLPGRRKYF